MMTGPLDLSRTRNGSGTAWQPDEAPMLGWMWDANGWILMVHENVFAGVDGQSGPRGGVQVLSTNWVMGMASHALAGGEVGGRLMLDLEPLTATPRGYPLLLQSGEAYDGQPLHDRQHPHDLFMEVALMYTRPIADDVAIQLYAAASGEPALGPVAFPHRFSAEFTPLAPITHHWLDSSHVSFGVLTLGVFTHTVKLELSLFNGREPNQNRYDFDFRPLDSLATRVSWNPCEWLSTQLSYGFLRSPEELEPDIAVHRVTASALAHRQFSLGQWDVAFAYGVNLREHQPLSNAVLIESAVLLREHHAIFGRGEIVQKDASDLSVALPGLHTVGELTLGYVFSLAPVANIAWGIGASGTLDVVGAELSAEYGGRTPVGGMLFLQMRPNGMAMR